MLALAMALLISACIPASAGAPNGHGGGRHKKNPPPPQEEAPDPPNNPPADPGDPADPLSADLGVYRGAANTGGVDNYGNWLGTSVDVAEDFFAGTNWSTIESPGWWVSSWEGTGYRMSYGVPIIPDTGGSLATGASGAYNDHFRRLAELLVSGGQSDAILRLGWEFNGNWYRWRAKADPVGFIGYWRQIVNTMRSVPGADFAFDWNPTLGLNDWEGGTPFYAEDAYPGDEYVDYVGVDVYDQSWASGYQDPAVRWNEIYHGERGLVFWRNFAQNHGKPLSIPEWGVSERDDGHGGGDAPSFIQNMRDFIASSNVEYHVYFEFDHTDGAHMLSDGQFPQSAALYRELVGSG
ncbi:MAG: glycoside hydrolase family 26 protein [Acidimicrobiia bacterium]|nr:glycoside hydrolase family 26 protein [Acidimicrobiia bacterium]